MGWLNILFEIGLIFMIAYGYKHEQDLIELEKVLKQYIERRIKYGRL